MIHCASCGTAVEGRAIGRRDECPACGADLHSCQNCDFYDQAAYGGCRETSADPISDRTRANFCDWFRPQAGTRQEAEATGAKEELEALFRKK